MPRIDARVLRDNLSRLLDRIDHGENFTIERGGRAIARIVPALAPVPSPTRPDRNPRLFQQRSHEPRQRPGRVRAPE